MTGGEGTAEPGWTTLDELPPGALFETEEGWLAVVSDYSYPNGQRECILLASGEYAHFPEKNGRRVREVVPTPSMGAVQPGPGPSYLETLAAQAIKGAAECMAADCVYCLDPGTASALATAALALGTCVQALEEVLNFECSDPYEPCPLPEHNAAQAALATARAACAGEGTKRG